MTRFLKMFHAKLKSPNLPAAIRRNPSSTWVLAFAILLGAFFLLVPGRGATVPSDAAGPSVSVYLTTDDHSKLLQPQPNLKFFTGTAGPQVIDVDESQQFQEMEGFGAAFTDSAAYLLKEVAKPAMRERAMRNLFTREGGGIGLNFMRLPMGASDITRSVYSYDEMPAGQTDPNLDHFSVSHDQRDIIPIILQARKLNPQLEVMATPWSPPGWMKSSGSMIGGSLIPAQYGPFAGYFVKFIQAYSAAGIPIQYISLQNEPLYVPSDYPGMFMGGATQKIVLRDFVLPALTAAKLSTRVLIYDHNWDRPDFATTVLSDPVLSASNQIAGIAWHGYAGTADVMTTLHQAYPNKPSYQTEHSGGTWNEDQTRTDFEEMIQVIRNWCTAFVKWSLALDEKRGPHKGGCGTCSPLVTVNIATGAVTYDADFYTLGHFSRFVLPGARRIYSSETEGIASVAFLNPDNSKALVVYNHSRAAQSFDVQWRNRKFNYLLPPLAGATFAWSGTPSGRHSPPPN